MRGGSAYGVAVAWPGAVVEVLVGGGVKGGREGLLQRLREVVLAGGALLAAARAADVLAAVLVLVQDPQPQRSQMLAHRPVEGELARRGRRGPTRPGVRCWDVGADLGCHARTVVLMHPQDDVGMQAAAALDLQRMSRSSTVVQEMAAVVKMPAAAITPEAVWCAQPRCLRARLV